ncbi:hypothetical protein CXU14_02010 [Akkermansia muciniphila]|nr:hypothetical protein CXU16_03150 [Akkermansia muciniphila]PNC45992.1 hypothetical protein CXU14_02010 [Akkermansia muciniphila]
MQLWFTKRKFREDGGARQDQTMELIMKETPANFQNHLGQLQTGVNQKKQGASMVLVEQFRERKTPRNA